MVNALLTDQVRIRCIRRIPPGAEGLIRREELREEVVEFAGSLAVIALMGTGGIWKTAIALTVLHHDRIERRCCGNFRFRPVRLGPLNACLFPQSILRGHQ
jgi:hypothetical protein